MTAMQVQVEHRIEGGVRLGIEPCACGGCHPTATAYEGDPRYERHDPALAEGPCSCGRFFVLADSPERARQRAEALRARPKEVDDAGRGYLMHTQRLRVPWGDEVVAVIADLPTPVGRWRPRTDDGHPAGDRRAGCSTGVLVGSGTWTAIGVEDLTFYGCGEAELPRNFCGGVFTLTVQLVPAGGAAVLDGRLRVDCLIGDFPPTAVEGIMLDIPGLVNFDETIFDPGGLTVYVSRSKNG